MKRLDAVVRERFDLSWSKTRDHIASGKVWVQGQPVLDPAFSVDTTLPFELELKMNAPRRSALSKPEVAGAQAAVLSEQDLVFFDSQIVVVNKPAGMSTVPYKNDEPNTLDRLVARRFKQSQVSVVHRLDRETSGLIAFARTPNAARTLENQFRFRMVQRRYFAIAHGRVKSQTIRSHLIEDRGDGLRGSVRPGMRAPRDEMKAAITHVHALAELDGATLIECQLETGRTHQIRIHLGEAGHPLLGEKAYCRDTNLPKIEVSRLMLHAAELGILHPTDRVPMRWTRLPPRDFMGQIGPAAAALLEKRLSDLR